MAKIAQTRFPDPPEQYDPRAFSELVRQLEQIVLQLNSSYQEDNKNEILRRLNFLQGDGAGQGGIDLSDLSVSTGSASGGGSLSYNNTTGVFSFVPASVPTAVDNAPAFFVKLSSNQSIPNNTATKVTFDSEVFDTDNAFASNKFTVPTGKGGKYFLNYGLNCSGLDDTESIQAYIYKNGSNANFGFAGQFSPASNQEIKFTASTILDLSASDYIELYVQHFEGSSMDLNATNTFLTGYKLI